MTASGMMVTQFRSLVLSRAVFDKLTECDSIEKDASDAVSTSPSASQGRLSHLIGFVSKQSCTAYGLWACRGNPTELDDFILPSGVSVLAGRELFSPTFATFTTQREEPKLLFRTPDGFEIPLQVADDLQQQWSQMALPVRLCTAVQVILPPKEDRPDKQIVLLADVRSQAVDHFERAQLAFALPYNDNAVFLATDSDADAKVCGDLAVVRRDETSAENWLSMEMIEASTGAAATKSRKKTGGKGGKPKKARGVSGLVPAREAPSEGKKSEETRTDPLPHGVAVELFLLQSSLNDEDVIEAPMMRRGDVDQDRALSAKIYTLDLDVIAYVERKAPLNEIGPALISGVERHLRVLLAAKHAHTSTTTDPDQSRILENILPEVNHFRPDGLPFLVSAVSSEDENQEHWSLARRSYHDCFDLPSDRPYFRRSCAAKISLADVRTLDQDVAEDGRLLCPHRGLRPPDLPAGEVFVTQGLYAYYHYLQDKFDDKGWGCAYRSLQSLISWARYQNYTDAKVPSHREIQSKLVELGDKPDSFIGSREWIGATEVCYVLEAVTGLSSKIEFMSSGAEMESKGRQLARHFQQEGSPIMIGGGVLAYTIVGVCFDPVTGETRFLIMDPHYTGGEDLRTVQGKGWIGWKKADLFVKTAYYNMCMPIRPKAL